MPVVYINHLTNNGIININNNGEVVTDDEFTQPLVRKNEELEDDLGDKALLEILKQTVIGSDENQDNIANEIDALRKRIEDFNTNVAVYDDLIREEEVRRVCGDGADEGWISSLQKWTGCSSCRVVYDSSNGLNGDTLWASLRLVTSIALIVETNDGDVFGSFHTIIPTYQHSSVKTDNAHFLFSLRNKFNTGHVKFDVLPKNNKLLDIYKGPNTWVFGVENGFWIHSKPNKSYISSPSANGELDEGYEDPTQLGGIVFTGGIYPLRFTTKRVIGLEFLIDEN